MKIVFLDIDGVLNTPRYVEYQVKYDRLDGWEAQFNFDPICMKNLKEIIDKTNSYIVVSSTWRLGNHKTDQGWQEILNNLRVYKIENRIIGYTPNLQKKYNSVCYRGYEIQEWLDQNEDKDIESFVIIDDDNDMLHLIDKLARCDEYYGLTNAVKENALEILNKN